MILRWYRPVTAPSGCAIGPGVRVLLSLLTMLMLLASLGVSTVAHAGEPFGCTDMVASASTQDHVDCGMVDVPADADKGYPHHHGVCHGHQIAAADEAYSTSHPRRERGLTLAADAARLSTVPSEAALEPPQA